MNIKDDILKVLQAEAVKKVTKAFRWVTKKLKL